ncbi:c-type cytochrome [Ghiorsea bivora]|uniref:c-type cytochrome n=1 Tax=Ghiorsea bivora TaxID=1485545 RepID=UPI00056F7A00|nr:cytochrome c [Ghiorsea bivora]
MNKAFHIMATMTIMLSLFPIVTQSAAEEGPDTQAIAESKPFTASAARGKITFDTVCTHCHNTTYEESRIGAPGLRGVLERHDVNWLNHWIKSPETFAKTDETAQALIESNKFGLAMPTLPTMQDDHNRADIIEYLKTLQ